MQTRKNPGEQATLGYRPLPSGTPSRGPEMATMVCIIMGAAMGIVTGTVIADGSWRALIPSGLQHSVQASTTVPAPAQAAVAKVAKAVPVLTADTKAVTAVAPTDNKTITQTSVAASKPVTETVAKSVPAVPPTETTASPIHKVLASQKTSSSHKRRHGRLRRHRAHVRHRHPTIPKPVESSVAALQVEEPKPPVMEQDFSFMIEGSATITNYDATMGMIETFEGEAFTLDKPAIAGTVSWLDYPAGLQYRCDQSWNCTLFGSGGMSISARRMR